MRHCIRFSHQTVRYSTFLALVKCKHLLGIATFSEGQLALHDLAPRLLSHERLLMSRVKSTVLENTFINLARVFYLLVSLVVFDHFLEFRGTNPHLCRVEHLFGVLGVVNLVVLRFIYFALVHASLHDHDCDEDGVNYEITDGDRYAEVTPPEQNDECISRSQQQEDGVANEAIPGNVDRNDRPVLLFTSLKSHVHDK